MNKTSAVLSLLLGTFFLATGDAEAQRRRPSKRPAKNVPPCGADSDCANPDPCQGLHYCDKSQSPPKCMLNSKLAVVCSISQNTACRKSVCDPKTAKCSLASVRNGTWCSDNDSLTVGDACFDGQCVPGKFSGECKKQEDCASKEDGDLCNGTLYCELATGKCLLNPATVVSCPSVDDNACQKNLCQKTTGKCVSTPINENGKCDDSDSRTQGDKCIQGKCKGDKLVGECGAASDCDSKSKGDLCIGKYYCDYKSFKCVHNPATVVVCQTGNDTQCAKQVCVPKTGKCELKNLDGATCDDGNKWTEGDQCLGGTCIPGKFVGECAKNKDCEGKKAENMCAGKSFYCDKSKAKCVQNPASAVTCKSTLKDCSVNVCNPKTGDCEVQPANEGMSCNDGDPNTADNKCVAGECVGTPRRR